MSDRYNELDSLMMQADIANQEDRINSASAEGSDVGSTDNHWADRRPNWELPEGDSVKQHHRRFAASMMYDAVIHALRSWDKGRVRREASRSLLWKAVHRATKEEA